MKGLDLSLRKIYCVLTRRAYNHLCEQNHQNLLIIYRKDEAVNRPKMEFVPKTLADLQIEGIHDLNNGRRYGSTQSLSQPRRQIPPSSSVGDLSNTDPFRAWEMPTPPKPKIEQNHRPVVPGFKPHPAPRNQFNGRDPWTGEFGFVCWLCFCSISIMTCTFWF